MVISNLKVENVPDERNNNKTKVLSENKCRFQTYLKAILLYFPVVNVVMIFENVY